MAGVDGDAVTRTLAGSLLPAQGLLLKKCNPLVGKAKSLHLGMELCLGLGSGRVRSGCLWGPCEGRGPI